MKRYTVAMATYYNGEWHIDRNTESVMMSKDDVIIEGKRLASLGAFPMYTKWVGGKQGKPMIEYNGQLEYAIMSL